MYEDKERKKFLILSVFIIMMVSFSYSIVFAGEIHNAARSGDLKRVRELLNSNPGLLNEKDSKGFTPIHCAVVGAKIEVVRFLVEKGADLDAKNKNGLSPLFTALDRGRNSIAAVLIDNGADLNFRGYLGRNLLHMAARSGNVSVARLLLDKGIDVNSVDSGGFTPLGLSFIAAQESTARLLIDRGGSLNALKPESDEYQNHLNDMINRGKSGILKIMLDLSDKINYMDYKGRNLMHRAAASGQLDIVNVLINKGMNVNKKDYTGRTPLYYAAKHGFENIVDLLLSKDAVKSGDLEENFTDSRFLEEKLEQGEAYIWYMSHAAWAVKTKNHLLIFDYTQPYQLNFEPKLSNGHINPVGIKEKNVSVFVSHAHSDHYDSRIFNWKTDINNIEYILGFMPRGRSRNDYTYIGPNEKKIINGMEILTIKSTDSGVGFIVNVDGIKIFHAGDHANTESGISEPFSKEIAYISEKEKDIDIAFMLLGASCGGQGNDYEEVKEGLFYTLNKLSPKVFFPMHARNNENLYLQFKQEALDKNVSTPIICADLKGDRFFYSGGKVN